MSRERAAQLIDAGIWLKLSGDIDGARRLFERALKLDPENEKARELLTAPAAADVASGHSVVENPFERAAALGSDWGAATQVDLPATESPSTEPEVPTIPVAPVATVSPSGLRTVPTSLDSDWGRATGSSPSPVPAIAPVAPPVPTAAPTAAPRQTLMFSGSGAFQSTPSQARGTSPFSGVPPTRSTLPFASGNSGVTEQPAARQTLPFATSKSGSAFADEPPVSLNVPTSSPSRSTLPFGGSSPSRPGEAGANSSPARSTLPFAGSSPSRPGDGAPAGAAGRSTLPFGAITPEPPSTSSPSGLRSTMAFSQSTVGPLTPSALPEVSPVVVKLTQTGDDFSEEDDDLVATLKRQVDEAKAAVRPFNSGAKPVPAPPPSAPDPLFPNSTVVLVDRTPEPSPPAATPPMYMEEPSPPGLTPNKSKPKPAPQPMDDAWNWSTSAASAASAAPPAAEPRPSPLAPQASSAWDQRSNPGINMDDLGTPNRTLEFVSSPSKITAGTSKKKPEEISALMRGARDLIDLDDHTGAMELIDRAQTLAPNDREVQALRERSERTLLAMFESKLGHLDKIPRVMLKDDEIIWLNLDHRAGFVLAQIDGTVTFEDLFAVSGMSRLDTARILAQLVDEGVISRA